MVVAQGYSRGPLTRRVRICANPGTFDCCFANVYFRSVSSGVNMGEDAL
jgi:hypothetical protein